MDVTAHHYEDIQGWPPPSCPPVLDGAAGNMSAKHELNTMMEARVSTLWPRQCPAKSVISKRAVAVA
jgi:hypothetical protein